MKVVLIGDSIRMGYQPFVQKKCKNMDVWGPAENCRHSLWALDHFHTWVSDQKPDIVHVNFGIHDAVPQDDGVHQILPDQYKLCLQRFIARVKQLKDTRMIWATTTPLYKPDEDIPMADWPVWKEAKISEYNAAARDIAEGEGLPVNDLHDVILRNDYTKCLIPDGCHMTEYGNEVLSDAVVEAIRKLS